MILKETLRKIVKYQKENISLMDNGISREIKIPMNISHAIILSGIRRCGKSTLLNQLMKNVKNAHYFNFEDPKAVNFELSDFDKLVTVLEEEYGKSGTYFFDEIQNVEKWEVFVRSMLDKKKRFFITGSNASMLSRELGTKLTGRHLTFELFPFSFNEMLKLGKKRPGIKSFEHFLENGGFPEFLKYKKPEILNELLNDIVARDIIVRHGIRNQRIVKDMAVFLLTNIGKEFSYNSLKKTFNLGSVNTAISFVSFFEDSYMLFTLPKFGYSFRKQVVNPKKIYSIDNGFSKSNSASFSDDKGRMLENMVFISLRRNHKDLYYFKKGKECDFVVKENGKVTKVLQVTYRLTEDNKKREISGLTEAMDFFGLKNGTILTYNQEDNLTVDNKKISVLPVWKWATQK